MSIAELPISLDEEQIKKFCVSHGIFRMSLFGSVLRDDFDSKRSDVDVFAEFAPDALRGVGINYFGYGDELGEILGRKVDFCARINKYIQPKIRREMVTIYERS